MKVRISDAISKDQVNFLAGKSLNGTEDKNKQVNFGEKKHPI